LASQTKVVRRSFSEGGRPYSAPLYRDSLKKGERVSVSPPKSAYSWTMRRETRQQEHERLQKRTDELKREHADLALDIAPFNKTDHDAHTADLRQHQHDLGEHKERKD